MPLYALLKEKLVKHNQETYRSKFKHPSQEDNLSRISENSIEDKRSSPEQEIIENSLSESSIGSERGNSPKEHRAGLLSTIDSHPLNEFIGGDCFSSSSDSVIDDTPKKIDHHVHATEARIYTGIDLVPNALINKTGKNDLSSNGPIIQKNIIAPSTCDPKNQNFIISETPELDMESSSSDATYAEPISPKIIPSKVPSELLPQCSTFEECEVVLTKMFASTPTPQLTNGKGVPKYATVEKSTGNAECTTPKFVCFDIVDTSKTVKNNVNFLQHNISIDTPKMKATEEKNCDRNLEIKPKRANKFFKSKTPLENAPNTVISPLKKAKTIKNKDKPLRNVTKRKAPKAKNVDLGKSLPFKRSNNSTVSVRSASKRKLFTHADDSYISVDESKYSKKLTPSNVYDIDAYSDSSEVFKPPKLTKLAGNITSSKEKSLLQDESLPSRRTRGQNAAKPSQTNRKAQKTAKNAAGGRGVKNEAKKNTIDISSRINHLYFGDVETMRSAPFIQNRTANSPPTAINDCIQKDTEFNQLLSMTPLTMKPAPKKTVHKKNKIFRAEAEDKELDFLILEPDRPPRLFDVLNSTGFSNFASGDLNIAELNTSAIITPPPQPNNLDISAEMVYTANRCESPILSLHGSFICLAEDTPYNARSPSTADAHCERNQEVSSNLAVKKSSKISKRRTTIALDTYKETPLPRTVSAADGIRSQRNEKAVDKEDCPYPAANQRNNNLSIITARHLSPPKGVQPDKKCSKISGRRATTAFERVTEPNIVRSRKSDGNVRAEPNSDSDSETSAVGNFSKRISKRRVTLHANMDSRTPPKTNVVFGRMDSYETSQSTSQSQRRITRSMTETNRTSSPYLLSQRPTMASQLVDFFPDNHELSRLSSSQLSGSDAPDVPPKKQTKRSENATIAESFRPLQSTAAKRTARRKSTKDISEIPDEFRKSFMKTVERLLVKETIPKAMTITRKKLGL